MPPKFKPPQDEADRRMIARELFVKGKSPEDVVQITGLAPETVAKIFTWCKSDAGQMWLKKRGLVQETGSQQSVPEQSPAPAAEETAPAPPSPPPGLPSLSQVAPAVQSRAASPGSSGQQQGQLVQYIQLTPEQLALLLEKNPNGGPPPAEQGGSSPVVIKEGAIPMDQPALTGKYTQTFLKPWTILWYMRMVGLGYKRDVASFIEECVTGHMKEKYGMSYALVREE